MPELGSEGVGGVNRLEGSVRTGRGSCQANRGLCGTEVSGA